MKEMITIKNFAELRKAAKERFACKSPIGLKASVDGVLEFIRKETGLLDVSLLHKTTIDIINDLAKEAFLVIPRTKRMVFIPHCLRNIKECKAKADEEGYACDGCGKCKISQIVDACKECDIQCHIVGGGSQVVKLVEKYRPKSVIGIACYNELKMGLDKMLEIEIPCQAVLLSRYGCVNTDVNVDEALAKIKM